MMAAVEPRIYRYQGGGWAVVGFLGIWSFAWLGALIAMAISGKITINDRTSTLQEGWPELIPFAAIGLGVLALTIRLGLSLVNERIEIERGEVRWIDWKGKERVRAALSEVRAVKEGRGLQGTPTFQAQTDRGTIRFSQGIGRFVELKRRLLQAASGDVGSASQEIRPRTLVVPPPIVKSHCYRYLGSVPHIFSFFWLGFTIFATYGLFFLNESKPEEFGILFGLSVLSIFYAAGIWMLLSGTNERIDVTDHSIRWTDWLGKVRVDARLEEVVGMSEIRDESNALAIETLAGTIRANSYLRGYSELKDQIRTIIAAQG